MNKQSNPPLFLCVEEAEEIRANLKEAAARGRDPHLDAMQCGVLVEMLDRLSSAPPAPQPTVDEVMALAHEAAANFGDRLYRGDPFLELREAVTRLAASAADQWRTIESAPKDGTAVLIYHPEGGVCEAFCSGNGYAWQCMDGTNTVTAKSGLQIPRMTAFVSDPTHWMPLPPAPKPTTGD